MSGPTVATRLQRRVAFLSDDDALGTRLEGALPQGWAMRRATDLATLGDFADILQYRFLILDLDAAAFDPLEVMDTLRREMMLNVAILCIGGSPALRDAARLARADRFFERAAAVEVLLQFCGQYDW